jgi:hypothetical protein
MAATKEAGRAKNRQKTGGKGLAHDTTLWKTGAKYRKTELKLLIWKYSSTQRTSK